MSNLIPITKIYDIYPKYTFSKDVMRFMDDIVDIPRAEVFSKDEVVAMLTELQLEIEEKKFLESSCSFMDKTEEKNYAVYTDEISELIQQKINKLRGNENE